MTGIEQCGGDVWERVTIYEAVVEPLGCGFRKLRSVMARLRTINCDIIVRCMSFVRDAGYTGRFTSATFQLVSGAEPSPNQLR